MENQHNNQMVNSSGKIWAGVFIIVIGGLLLLDNFFLNLPNWLFSWHTFLLALGLFIGAKHRFRGAGWFFMVLVGAFFTADAILPREFPTNKILFPSALVLLGLFMIFKPKSHYQCDDRFRRRNDRWKKRNERWNNRFGVDPNAQQTYTQTEEQQSQSDFSSKEESRNDYLDSVNVFGGSHPIVYSKNFKGGDVVAVFGGCDANLSQADFEGEIVLDVTAVFGGVKIIIPQGWVVKHEVTAILGGVDDKRAIMPLVEGAPKKVLILRGLAMFGGIDIRNY